MAHPARISRNELAKGRGQWPLRRLLLAAALALVTLFLVPVFGTGGAALAQTPPLGHCDSADADELWCASLTVGVASGRTGFTGPGGSTPFFGSLTSTTFTRSTATIRIAQIHVGGSILAFSASRTGGTQPADGLLGAGNFTLEFGTGASKQTGTFTDPTATTGNSFFHVNPTNPGLSWSENDVVPVRLVRGPNPATGAPEITGSANLGQELTAGAGTIADLDGLPAGPFPTGYTFQWVRVDGATDTDITGATSSTYRLVAADVGKKVKVKVSFTDGGGAAEELTSEAFPSGTISGTRITSLLSLEVSNGAFLTPSFTHERRCTPRHPPSPPPEACVYVASVPNNVSRVTMTAVASDPAATVEIYPSTTLGLPLRDADSDTPGFQVDLGIGHNFTTIVVRNGEARVDYYVRLYRGYHLANNGTITVTEGQSHVFKRSDFRFRENSGNFFKVHITSLPAAGKGKLTVNGTILGSGHLPQQARVKGFLNEGLVRYIAPETGHGDDFATFTFEVTALEAVISGRSTGVRRSVGHYTMTVNVTHNPNRRPRIEPYRPAADSLVSNVVAYGNATTGQLGDFDKAQRFSTGPHAGGYTLNSVVIRMRTDKGRTALTVQVAKDSPGATTDLITLVAPPLEPDRGPYRVVYTAPPNTTLEANTDYFVVIKGGIADHCCYPTLDSTDGIYAVVAEPGWSMQKGFHYRQLRIRNFRTGVEVPHAWPWRFTGGDTTYMIEIRGTAVGSGAVAVDPPTVEGTPVLSGAGSDGTWSEGESVRVALTFNESVDVDTSAGTPSIGVELGDASARRAVYESGSGTTTLTFAYTLVAGDGSHTSMAVTPNSLTLGGGTIRSSENALDALLGHVGTEAVDQAAPELQSAGVDGALLTLTYDEPLDNTSTPRSSAFSVNVNGESRPLISVGLGQSNVLLFLSAPVAAGDIVTVGYTAPTGESESKVQDTAGNAAASFSGHAVTNDTESSGGAESGEGEQSETRDASDATAEDDAAPGDTTPPGLSSAAVDGADLTLTFDEALDEDTVPGASAFAVTAAGAGVGVVEAAASGRAVTLTLAAAVVRGRRGHGGLHCPGGRGVRPAPGPGGQRRRVLQRAERDQRHRRPADGRRPRRAGGP